MRYTAKTIGLLSCILAMGWVAASVAADPPSGQKILVAKTFRATKLTGLNVRNHQGELIGKAEDLVINVETGKVDYIAVGVGGILGVGEKLFAIPFAQMKFDHGKNEQFFVLDVSKEKLQGAPGFDKQNWPNFADPNWHEQIDNYYKRVQTTTSRKEVVR